MPSILHQQVLHQLEAGDRLAELLAAPACSAARARRRRGRSRRPARRRPSGSPASTLAVSLEAAAPPAAGSPPARARRRRWISAFCTTRSAILSSLSTSKVMPVGALLDDEALDLVVVVVAGPDDDQVGEGGVADPLLLAVEHPARRRRGGRSSRRPPAMSEPVLGLGQAEGADQLHPRHRRQPALLLLVGAAEVDRAHRQAAVHAHEGLRSTGRRGPAPSRPCRRAAAPGRGSRGPSYWQAGDAELGEPGDQVVRELARGSSSR